MTQIALLIIAPEKFRDEEYFHTKEELENADIEVVTASKSVEIAKATLGATVEPDITLRDVNANDYDAIVFIGGSGSSIYFNNPIAHQIAKDSAANGKILAAICIAPSILANAGLLKGVNATAFSSEEANLRAKGANWTGDSVTIDGNIITANGPGAARDFGRYISEALNG